jgi:hypothetical protein
MNAAAAQPRALRIAYWTVPPLAALWFYWLAIKTWFVADDFAWLNHATEFQNLREFLRAVFVPMAQGTIRPWSDRLFFIIFYRLFALDALPFHIVVMLTQCANILLLLSIARRLTGSRLAGFAAALFWIFNTSQPMALAWTSAYNEPLCALFILGAFHFLLRYLETGERRYWILQWLTFLLGFGALELNVLYPALAATYTFLCARKYFTRTLPLFVPSILYAIVHRAAAPPATGLYAMHFGAPMLKTLRTYWTWSLGTPPAAWATVLLTIGVLGAMAYRVRKGERLPIFFLAWFLILIAPVLPLSGHLTEYYPFLPTIGLAMAGGWAVTNAWRSSVAWKLVAAALAIIYFAFSAPAAHRTLRWQYERSRNVRKVVLGVERAHELHPNKTILLDGITDEIFWSGIVDNAFPLAGTRAVYLTPGTEKQIVPHPANGDPSPFLIPPGPAWHALTREEAVVYSAAEERLRNITKIYTSTMPPEWENAMPPRVDVANPAEAYLLGEGWYELEGNHRWMARKATLHLAGPKTAQAKLHASGIGGPASTRVILTVDGTKLPERSVLALQAFDLEWPVPQEAIGKASVEIVIEADKAGVPPAYGRELGLVFGVVETRE